MPAKIGIILDGDGVSSVAIVGSADPHDRAAALAILEAVGEDIDALHEAVLARLRVRKVVDTPAGRRRVDAEVRRLRAWCEREGIPWTPPSPPPTA